MSSDTISISEAQLEDFFIQTCDDRLGLRFVARQVRLDCGVMDVLCYADGVFYVVELKAGELRAADLAQVLAYTCEFKAKHPHKTIRPLLIGSGLRDDFLKHCLSVYDFGTDHVSACEYRLYGFCASRGIGFRWLSPKQKKLEDGRIDHFSKAFNRFSTFNRDEATAIVFGKAFEV